MKNKTYGSLLLSLAITSVSQASLIPAHVENQMTPPENTLSISRERLRTAMGVNPLTEDGPISLINIPIYPHSMMVVHRGKDVDFTPQPQTLPFATFITEETYEHVIEFYKRKVPTFYQLKSNNEYTFVKNKLNDGIYPIDYSRIPSINIHPYKLSNNKTGTLFNIVYSYYE